MDQPIILKFTKIPDNVACEYFWCYPSSDLYYSSKIQVHITLTQVCKLERSEFWRYTIDRKTLMQNGFFKISKFFYFSTGWKKFGYFLWEVGLTFSALEPFLSRWKRWLRYQRHIYSSLILTGCYSMYLLLCDLTSIFFLFD